MYLQELKFKLVTAGWALKLQSFDYEVEHRSGSVDDILVVKDNAFELNFSVSQGRDSTIRRLPELLEKSEHRFLK